MAGSTSEHELLSIGDVARIFGVDVTTVRRWERAGRIHSSRTLGNHRRYTPAEIERALAELNEAS